MANDKRAIQQLLDSMKDDFEDCKAFKITSEVPVRTLVQVGAMHNVYFAKDERKDKDAGKTFKPVYDVWKELSEDGEEMRTVWIYVYAKKDFTSEEISFHPALRTIDRKGEMKMVTSADENKVIWNPDIPYISPDWIHGDAYKAVMKNTEMRKKLHKRLLVWAWKLRTNEEYPKQVEAKSKKVTPRKPKSANQPRCTPA